MRTHAADPRTVVVAPAVVGAALGCREPEASALTLRLLATAALFNDPRWPAWSRFHKAARFEERRAFDAVLVVLIAGMDLDWSGRFPADHFFDMLLDTFAPKRVV